MVLVINGEVIEHGKRINRLLMLNHAFQNWRNRLDIMSYQISDASKMFKIYASAFPEKAVGYDKEGELALAAVLVQLDLFCAQKGIDFDKLRDLGYQRLLAKSEEVHAKGGEMI